MLVKCISNDLREVKPSSELRQELKSWFGTDTHSLDLKVGAVYVVYAVEVFRGWARYFVADEVFSSTLYLMGYFSSFFKVVDSRVSQCWVIQCRELDTARSKVIFSFEEWAMDPMFYERLLDGADREQRTFRRRKEFMDLEFPNPLIAGTAEALNGGWLLCPKCNDSWQPQSMGGMTRCPKCGALLLNPLYSAGKC